MKRISLLSDKNFKHGFSVRGLGNPIYGDPIEFFGDPFRTNVVFQYEKEDKTRPQWTLSQWATRYPFHDIKNTTHEKNYSFMRCGDGIYRYDNPSKTLKVNTNIGEVGLMLRASACYKEPRRAGQEWPHLLIERSIGPKTKPVEKLRLSTADHLRVRLDIRVDEYRDYMGDTANPELHAIIFIYYLFLAYFNPKTSKYEDMLWFGLPLWDNRRAFTPLQSFPDEGTKESATGKWIYNNATENFFTPEYNLYTPDGKKIFGEWRSVDLDVLPLAKKAIDEAHAHGYMKSADWQNLFVNGMYFGFESCGTYDAGVSVKNIDLIREC